MRDLTGLSWISCPTPALDPVDALALLGIYTAHSDSSYLGTAAFETAPGTDQGIQLHIKSKDLGLCISESTRTENY